jgi:hypothetical protein
MHNQKLRFRKVAYIWYDIPWFVELMDLNLYFWMLYVQLEAFKWSQALQACFFNVCTKTVTKNCDFLFSCVFCLFQFSYARHDPVGTLMRIVQYCESISFVTMETCSFLGVIIAVNQVANLRGWDSREVSPHARSVHSPILASRKAHVRAKLFHSQRIT